MRKLLLSILVSASVAMSAQKAVEVVNYSFDDNNHPSLTAGVRSTADYSHTSVATSTAFLNLYSSGTGQASKTSVNLEGEEDLAFKTWTLTFRWAGIGGGQNKNGETILKSGADALFTLTDAATGSNTIMTLTYGTSGSFDVPCAGYSKTYRFSKDIADVYNSADFWCLFTITGDPDDGVLLTIQQNGVEILKDAVLSVKNRMPTELAFRPGGSGGAIGLDELRLSYSVDYDVVQKPTAEYSAVDGINRTISAYCATEEAVLYHSLDGSDWTLGESITVSESCKIYFKAIKNAIESEVLEFDAEAGTTIQLNQPVLTHYNGYKVNVTADQNDVLLKPAVQIAYTYGSKSGFLASGDLLDIEEDDVIYAYCVAAGYDNSAVTELPVALFPSYKSILQLKYQNGWSENTWGAETVVSERTYAVLKLDGTAWSEDVLLWKDGEFGIRNTGHWYTGSDKSGSWFLFRSLKKGDIIVFDVKPGYPSLIAINATYVPKYSYDTHHSYLVEADGDVEVFMAQPDSGLKYFYGLEVFTAEGSATAIDQMQTDHQQSIKLIRNGRLLIERNGQTYTAQGQEVQ